MQARLHFQIVLNRANRDRLRGFLHGEGGRGGGLGLRRFFVHSISMHFARSSVPSKGPRVLLPTKGAPRARLNVFLLAMLDRSGLRILSQAGRRLARLIYDTYKVCMCVCVCVSPVCMPDFTFPGFFRDART